MPFKSEKQRKFMYAKHPAIAKRLSKKYGSKIVKKARIITDSEEFKKYDKYLLSNGGKGLDEEGNNVYRVLSGHILPLGGAFTESPAASVRGILNLEQSTSSSNNNNNNNTHLLFHK